MTTAYPLTWPDHIARAKAAHPDAGGSSEAMQGLIRARDEAMEQAK